MLAQVSKQPASTSYRQALLTTALGFFHSRTKLSPFTKVFRGRGHSNECLSIIFRLPLFKEATRYYNVNKVHASDFSLLKKIPVLWLTNVYITSFDFAHFPYLPTS